MAAGVLRALWTEPRVLAPPGVTWWDRALVAGLVPLTVLEAGLGTDVVWPVWQAGWALVCVATLLWRPHRPLLMLVVAYSAQTVAGVFPALAGERNGVLNVTAVVLLVAYSLGRWASGRAVAAGTAFLLVVHLAREPLYEASSASIVIGVGALMLPVALGAVTRFWVRSQQREREEIRVRERERLARDLHDTVAHHLSGILLHTRAAKIRARTDPGQAVDAIEDVETAAARSLEDMRTLVALLREDEEPGQGRTPAYGVADLGQLADDPGTGPRVVVETVGDVSHLPGPVSTAVFRAAQEAVANARRHAAGATVVHVRVAADADAVELRVHDDGQPVRTRPRRATPSFGLVGMRERFSLLGGHVTAGPDPEGGWTVSATVPTAYVEAGRRP